MFVNLTEAKELAILMSEKLPMDFVNFSLPFYRRRLAYACERLNVRKPQQLVEMLHQDEFCRQLVFNMTVPVSEMFRDPGFWRTLRQVMLQRPSSAPFKVWFPDLASGEELYSFLIMIYQIGLIDSVSVVVHHPSDVGIEDTRKGLLPLKSIKINLSNFERIESKDQFDSFFDVIEKNYYLKPELLKKVVFSSQYFIESHTADAFDLIFFRNSGLVLTKSHQDYCCNYLIDHLKPKGLFVIGIKENLADAARNRLVCVNEEEKIFEKQII